MFDDNLFKKIIPKRFRKRGTKSRDFLLEKMPKNSICAEIGVLRGDFSERILRIVKPKKLYLIDPWEFKKRDPSKVAPGSKVGEQKDMNNNLLFVNERFSSYLEKSQVVIEKGYSVDVLDRFDDESLDWIYIDGNHNYEFVKKDLEVSLLKIRKGGYITGDDYGNDGKWWDENTTRAVDEFILKSQIKLIQKKNHQFIIQKI